MQTPAEFLFFAAIYSTAALAAVLTARLLGPFLVKSGKIAHPLADEGNRPTRYSFCRYGSLLLSLVLVGCVPSSVVAVSNIEFSGGVYSASVPFMPEQGGAYNVHLVHGSRSDASLRIPIEGNYALRNADGKNLFSATFRVLLDAADDRALITAFSVSHDHAAKASAFVIEIDSGVEQLRRTFSRMTIQLEKKGSVIFLD